MDRKVPCIRPVTENDTSVIYNFFSSLSATSRYFFRPHAFDIETARFITSDELKNDDIIRFIACIDMDDEEIAVGYVFLWKWTSPEVWLGIAVGDPYQGKHVGDMLMAFAISNAKLRGKKGIYLTTMKDNYRAQALYKKYGFTTVGEIKDDNGIEEYKMYLGL